MGAILFWVDDLSEHYEIDGLVLCLVGFRVAGYQQLSWWLQAYATRITT